MATRLFVSAKGVREPDQSAFRLAQEANPNLMNNEGLPRLGRSDQELDGGRR